MWEKICDLLLSLFVFFFEFGDEYWVVVRGYYIRFDDRRRRRAITSVKYVKE